MLAARQWQIRDLVLGPGTPYRLMSATNPFASSARADAGGARSQDHGSWSGSEWMAERVVPMHVLIDIPGGDEADWLQARHALAAAFAPSRSDIPLRFEWAGSEYVLFGRPRMMEPDTDLAALGRGFVRGAFVALDPRIYAGEETAASTGLPSSSGGLRWPDAWPQRWDATVTSGVIRVENVGKMSTRPRLVIAGPVAGPRVALVGSGRSLAWDVELAEGQWLDVDLGRHTSLINGQVSRAGAMTSRDWFELPPGVSELAFSAEVYDPASVLTVAYRSAWQ